MFLYLRKCEYNPTCIHAKLNFSLFFLHVLVLCWGVLKSGRGQIAVTVIHSQLPRKILGTVTLMLLPVVFSEQLPCRSAEVTFFSVFSAKGVVKFGVKFWRDFPCYVFQGLGVRRKISPKFHVKNGAKNGTIHAKFTLLGRSADISKFPSRFAVDVLEPSDSRKRAEICFESASFFRKRELTE